MNSLRVAGGIRSELFKVRTSRPGILVFLSFIVLTVLWTGVSTGDAQGPTANVTYVALRYICFLMFFPMFVGLYVVATDQTRGAIATAVLAEPRRAWLVVQQLIVAAVCGFMYAVAGVIAAALTVLFAQHPHSLSQSGAESWSDTGYRALTVVVAFMLVAVIGAGLGIIARNPVIVIAIFTPLDLIPLLGPQLFGMIQPKPLEFLPSTGAAVFTKAVSMNFDPLPNNVPNGTVFFPGPTPQTGLFVLLGWTAVVVCGAVLAFRRRDAV